MDEALRSLYADERGVEIWVAFCSGGTNARLRRLSGPTFGFRHRPNIMELLVCVVNRDEKLEEILSGFLELGVTGATVIHSEGMGRVLSQEVPVFAGLQTLMSRSRPQNTTILSVIDSPEVMDNAMKMVQEVCGDFDKPSTGIIFTGPLSRVLGLAPELGSDED